MCTKEFNENDWTIERYINDIPIEEYSEEEKENLLRKMLIEAVHSIGFLFEGETDNNTWVKEL